VNPKLTHLTKESNMINPNNPDFDSAWFVHPRLLYNAIMRRIGPQKRKRGGKEKSFELLRQESINAQYEQDKRDRQEEDRFW